MNIEELDFNPYTCSLEELEEKISFYKSLSDFENDMQVAVKIFINSVYGCLGTKFYNLYNPNIAEAITLQGQDLIKYSAAKIDEYINDIWHTLSDEHIKIANEMKKIYDDFDVDKFLKLSKNRCNSLIINQIGGDTDSAYITISSIINECQIPDHQCSHFIDILYNVSLCGYIKNALNIYAEKFNCDENIEEFELEKVARTVIYVAKKNYVMDIAWKEGGQFIDPGKNIIYSGIDVVKGSTPPWCREKQKDFIKWMIDRYNENNKPTYAEIISKIKEYRRSFEMQNPDDILKSLNMNDYEKYVLEDKREIKFNDVSVPQHAAAAALYNHTLYNKAKKYLTKYSTIKKGDKVKIYYINDKETFAYLPYAFPVEFAPKIDYDTNFEKVMLSPLNRIIECAGYMPVAKNLTYSKPLW